MTKILGVCSLALLFGSLLAANPISLPLRAGYLGALILIGAAFWLRRHWQQRALSTGDDPSAAERVDTAAQLDERDIAISNTSIKMSYCCLIANALLTIITMAVPFQQVLQLIYYWRDSRQTSAHHG